jgi:hypothetical protein
MGGRMLTATAMAMRDTRRRPLILILLVMLPAYVITRSIVETEATPQQIGLPGGELLGSNMRDIHGAVMGGTVIAFAAGLVGVFVMQSALQGDRRLVLAGFRPGEAITARLVVVAAATALVVTVSAIVTAFAFEPASWIPFLAGLTLIGLIYAALGALIGAVLDKLAATYLILFGAMTDVSIVQNPMFGDGTPDGWAVVLPGYGPSRLMVDGAFSPTFHASDELVLSLAWTVVLGACAMLVLRRAVGRRNRWPKS